VGRQVERGRNVGRPLAIRANPTFVFRGGINVEIGGADHGRPTLIARVQLGAATAAAASPPRRTA
jgi:hypothetical protein